MMEMNARSPFLWDWENLVGLNTNTGEVPKKLQLIDSEFEGIEGFEVGSFYSSNGTGSDLGYASSSRSSKSASFESSTDKEIVGHKRELVNSELTRTSSTIESSVASGESLIALELGKRTYFEDVSAASNVKNSAFTSLPPNSAVKKSKSSSQNAEIPRCQVEGCNLDLSSAKDYHRKHRVCETHSKNPKVVINGVERRFCQQCSRFHGLSEFDQKKRSCRRRLSDHNQRRRKPKPEVIQFNSMRLAPSLYEGRNQLTFSFNQGSVLQTRHGTWDCANNSKVAIAKPSLFTSIKAGEIDDLYSTQNGLQSPENKVSHVSTHFHPSKGSSFEVFQRGMPVSMEASNMDATQDMRALSLLSTTSWGSCDPEPTSLDHSMLANQASLSHGQLLHMGGPPVSSEYWHAQQPASAGPVSNGSTFQLFKAPNEPSFYHY